MIAAVLLVALLLALIGFAFHVLLVVTLVAIVLWLGFAMFDHRRKR